MALVSVEDLRRLEKLEKDAQSLLTRRVAALALAAAAHARIRAERNGVPLPNSADTPDTLRKERLNALANLR